MGATKKQEPVQEIEQEIEQEPEQEIEAVQETMPIDERVEIFVPKGNANDDPNLLVGINNKTYILPRGKTSKVPQEVAFEIRRAIAAQDAADKRIDALLEASK